MEELDKKYNHEAVEKGKYEYWNSTNRETDIPIIHIIYKKFSI